jgi:hypothetical protein
MRRICPDWTEAGKGSGRTTAVTAASRSATADAIKRSLEPG